MDLTRINVTSHVFEMVFELNEYSLEIYDYLKLLEVIVVILKWK